MLMEEAIKKNKYFQAMRMKNQNIIDPLTKTICRASIIGYVNYLIRNEIHFTMGIVDVDNFKYVNDTYGHLMGDEILHFLARNVMLVLDEKAWIGRFGGDEFIIIFEGSIDYDDMHSFMSKLYRLGVRRPITLSTQKTISVTATTGLSAYPRDAKTYDDLFQLCDKCCYSGKQKGRNCFTIYVEYLHGKIDNTKSLKRSIAERIMQLYHVFDYSDKKQRIYKAMEYLTNDISMSGVAYIHKNKIRISYEKNEDYGLPPIFPPEYLKELEKKDYIRMDDYMRIRDSDPELFDFCYRNNLLSYLIYKVDLGERNFGYVLFYDSDFRRVWQDDDIALFTTFVKTLATIAHFGNA